MKNKFGKSILVALLLAFGVIVTMVALISLSVGTVPLAHAATITVNTTADELNADGDCSLREAIQAANTDAAVDACTAGNGADTIDMPPGTYTLIIPGAGEDANASGDLDITADLTIIGASAATTIIDGGGLDRVFHIVGGRVEIIGLTVQNGSAIHQININAFGVGGGIYNDGTTLTLNSSTISGNAATLWGGGIVNGQFGTLTLNSSSISGNTGMSGAGIYNEHNATATLNNTTVSGNSASGGVGGIENFGTLILKSSTVSDNTASIGSYGIGGIGNNGGTLILNSSTVSDNTGVTIGGIFSQRGNNLGVLTLTNSTVSGNTATLNTCTFGAGGIRNDNGPLTLISSTISDNTGCSASHGGIQNNNGEATLKNTIVAINSPSDCSAGFTSDGHNLDSDGSCSLTQPTDLANTNPLLGPLQDNGGPTATHALLPLSPAIDHIPLGNCEVTTDQRVVARPQGPACDIGAYEFVPSLFAAGLTGGQEVPPVVTAAKGIARLKLNAAETAMRFVVKVAQITDVTASHIHCGAVGVNGPVGVTLFSGGPVSFGAEPGILAEGITEAPDAGNGCGWADMADVIVAQANGATYVNVHTLVNAAGEIRGQIGPAQ